MTDSATEPRVFLAAGPLADLRRVQGTALAAGIVGLIVSGVLAVFWPAAFLRAYLAAYLLVVSIGLGCFAILMIYHLTGGAWGFVLRRPLEAGMRTLPLLAILFVPIGIGVHELYLWARPEEVAARGHLQHQQLYLNVPFFWLRAVLCFALWIVIAFFLDRWSRQQDATSDPVPAERLLLLSGPGLVVFGITIMFVAVDWVMSLQSAFHSSIIGPVIASGALLVGMAFTLLILGWLVRPPLTELVAPSALIDLGNLLFAFLIVWAYMEFFQYMLIWIANLQVDVLWYLPRIESGWRWLVWGLLAFHLTLPFFLLLFRDLKRSPRALAAVSALLLATHLSYLDLLVFPVFADLGWIDLAMAILVPIGVGGVWLAFYLWNLGRFPLLPAHDPNRRSALHLLEYDASEEAAERARTVEPTSSGEAAHA